MQNDENLVSNPHTAETAEKSTSKPPSIAKSTAKMSVATMFSRLTGFLKVIVLAYALGDGLLGDTYDTANVMPNIIFELIMGGILGSVIIPVYVQYMQEKDEDEVRYMINNLTNIIFVTAVVVSIIGFLFSPYFVKLMTLREPAKATETMVMFFRIFSIKIMFYALAAVFSGVLNSHRKFTIPMAAPILNNLVVIATVVVVFMPLYKSNLNLATLLLAIGTTLGVVAMALIQVPSAMKSGMRFQPTLNFRHPAVKQVGLLGLPMLGFAVTFQLNNYIIYMLLQDTLGGARAYTNAMQFFQLPYAIFAVSVTTAIFPELSRFSTNRDYENFKKTLLLGLRSTSFIIIPSAVFMAIMAKPIISLTLEHGNFGARGVALTSAVLTSFAAALLSFSLYNMLTRVYYSLQDMKTPLKIGAVSIPLQLAFNLLLIDRIGISGLPLSYALALTFAVALQLYILRRKIGPLGSRQLFTSMGKHLAAAAGAGVAMYLLYRGVEMLEMSRMVAQATEVFGAAVVGFGVYMGLALMLGVEEVDFIKRISRKVLRPRVNLT